MRAALFAPSAILAGFNCGSAGARGALFGDACLGLGYNINTDGSVRSPDAEGTFPTISGRCPGSAWV